MSHLSRRVALSAFSFTALTGAFYYTSTTRAFMSSHTKSAAHHHGNGFRNPWDSAATKSLWKTLQMIGTIGLGKAEAAITPDTKPKTVEAMNWDLIRDPVGAGEDAIVVTWLGHACALVQINGINILLDPVFSERCSPVSFAGPKRFSDPPCDLSDLPKIDAVVISHNHYDHLDTASVKQLAEHHPDAHFYVPLKNKSWFDIKDSDTRVTELDWWEHRTLTLGDKTVKFTCTPCQHFSGRGILDRNQTLWASWCLEGVRNGQPAGGKVFFGGDTGYRSVPESVSDKEYDDEYLSSLPHCPVFKEIGDKIGPFDLSLIPIGAYSPRPFMSPMHCSPEDAVCVHEDVRSKKSIGIHWGTFVLTNEPFNEPPARLRQALAKRGHARDAFDVLKLGESMVVSTV